MPLDVWATVYAMLPAAVALPIGPFTGTAWSDDLPGVALVNQVWRGKVFTGASVRNRIAGQLLVRGLVTLEDGAVVIRYAGGLTDRLKPLDGRRWLGRMDLGRRVVWFTLERDP